MLAFTRKESILRLHTVNFNLCNNEVSSNSFEDENVCRVQKYLFQVITLLIGRRLFKTVVQLNFIFMFVVLLSLRKMYNLVLIVHYFNCTI